MKFTIGDLEAHAFCPVIREHPNWVTYKMSGLQEKVPIMIWEVMKFLFARELETGKKSPSRIWTAKWVRTFWHHHDRKDEKSTAVADGCHILLQDLYKWYEQLPGQTALVGFETSLELKEDQIELTIPVVQMNNEKIELIFFDTVSEFGLFRRDVYVMASVLAIRQALPGVEIATVRGISLHGYKYKELQLHPNDAYYAESLQSVLGLTSAMKQGLRYPNKKGCKTCDYKSGCVY